MRVKSWEEGDRPTIMTRARQFAPQARRAFVEMLASQDWATHAFVVLDWTGTIAFIDPGGSSKDLPQGVLDKASPVMYIQVIKSMPQLGGSVVVEHRIEVDDVFGGIVITGADLADLVLQLKEELAGKEAHVRQEVNP